MSIVNNASKKSLSSIFDKSIFSIPKYQRAYSWDAGNWKELWEDIENNLIKKDKEHFLGAIIHYYGNPPTSNYEMYSIIDGQQRLTTITILMRVLYDKLSSINQKVYARFAEELYEKYIGNKKDENFYLNLSKKDELFFNDYIQKIEPNRKNKGKLVSNKRIRQCYEYFEQEVEKKRTSNATDFAEICWNLKKIIENNLIFVVIDVNTDVDAYVIFESINSKRKGLTISDLLKNYIFLAADNYQKEKINSKKLSEAEDSWDKIDQTLDKIEINQYIRHYWISKYNKVSEKELYQNIKEQFDNDPKKILTFLENLAQEVEGYTSIVNANIDKFPKDGIRALQQLQALRNKQYYSLILSALSSAYNFIDVSKLIKQIASVAVRRTLIGKNPNELESFFATAALRLRNDSSSLAIILKELGDNFWINDQEIIEELKKADFEDQEYLAKFILREYEMSLHPEAEKVISKVSLEHIYPRNPENNMDWDFNNKEDEFLWNIGNLALIGPSYNSKMSNKSFEKKKKILERSELKTTSLIAKYLKWNSQSVEKRNSEISNFFVKHWLIQK